MKLTHQTYVDPSLPHQVQFVITHNSMYVEVTCNCRSKRTKKAMGRSPNLDEARSLYNDPENHFIPFHPEKDKAKW